MCIGYGINNSYIAVCFYLIQSGIGVNCLCADLWNIYGLALVIDICMNGIFFTVMINLLKSNECLSC